MKKQLQWMVAAFAATALATPAFALTVDTKGFFEIRGQTDHNLRDGSERAQGDNDRAGVDQRLRLWTEAAADENVKGVFAFEYDGWWGDDLAADVGSDGKGTIEVKHVYLDFNLPAAQTNVKAGIQYFKIANGFIAADDAPGVQTATRLGDAATLKLYWVHQNEDVDTAATTPATNTEFASSSDDADFYGAQLDIKAGPLTFSPLFANTRYAKNQDIFFGGFDLAGKFGENTKLVATFVKNWGDNVPAANATSSTLSDTTGTDKIDGTAAYLGVFQTLGKADLSFEGAWIGDNGRTGGEFADGANANWGLNNATEILGGGRYDRRGGIGQGAGVAAANGIGDQYNLNQAYAKLGFGLKTSDTTKLSGYLAHVQQADGAAVVLGQELGAYYDITLAKGLNFNLAAAYLLNDDFGSVGGGNDDVYKLGTALTYKF